MFEEYNQQEAIGDAYSEGIEKGREEGIEKGREEGREEGLKEGLRNVARSLLADGLPAERVAALTGLSVSEVQKLT